MLGCLMILQELFKIASTKRKWRMSKYRFQSYKDCETCEGEGFIHTGSRAGFNVKNMEVTMEDDLHKCPNCSERSQDDYEYAMERKSEEARGN